MKFHIISAEDLSLRGGTLVEALEKIGVTHAPLGDAAKPVLQEPALILWTKNFNPNSIVSDQKLKTAAASGRLISVIVEKVSLPEELPKPPVIDLVSWRGSIRNPFFQDLRRFIEAASQKAPPPRPRGPVVRFLQRMCAGLTVGVIITFIIGFALNLLELQNNLCSINFYQPELSDFCGAYGLGGKPKEEERLAWEAREPGNCEALRAHIDLYGNTGELYARASAMLDARRIQQEEAWVADEQRLPLSQSISAAGSVTEEVAREEAISIAQSAGSATCSAFESGEFYRSTGFEIVAENWDCFSLRSGFHCGFDGKVICRHDRLNRSEREVCGSE